MKSCKLFIEISLYVLTKSSLNLQIHKVNHNVLKLSKSGNEYFLYLTSLTKVKFRY